MAARAGVGPEVLDLVFISHLHPDHTSDLGALFFALRYGGYDRGERPLRLLGPPGFRDFLSGLEALWGEWIAAQGYRREVGEVDGREQTFGPLSLRFGPVAHLPHSRAIRIETGGRSLVYSGDTEYSEELIGLARGCQLLVLEAAFPDGQGVSGHLTPSDAGKMAEAAGVGRLVLTHFYPPCEGVDLRAQCAQTFSGEILLAEDLMTIEV